MSLAAMGGRPKDIKTCRTAMRSDSEADAEVASSDEMAVIIYSTGSMSVSTVMSHSIGIALVLRMIYHDNDELFNNDALLRY